MVVGCFCALTEQLINELTPLVETCSGPTPEHQTYVPGSVSNFLGVMTDQKFLERHHANGFRFR